MTRAALAVATLLLLAACHREAASDAPDADADLRAKTAAKTLADLSAADAAARAPLSRPVHVDRPVEQRGAPAADAEAPAADDASVPTENGAD